jgi:hypothetical protein
MALKRMDNVGIVVDDLAATIDFFRELGLELEGRATVEGPQAAADPSNEIDSTSMRRSWSVSTQRGPGGKSAPSSALCSATRAALPNWARLVLYSTARRLRSFVVEQSCHAVRPEIGRLAPP